MSSQKTKLIVIVGPTASGKSELAVRLAKKYKGEIISADSRQVYKNLNIGTGKVAGKWLIRKSHFRNSGSETSVFVYKGIPHHCIDFVAPQKQFSVAEFKTCAARAIKDIRDRGRIAILAGGTGLYIQAVVDNLAIPEVAPNKKLRANLEKKTPVQLFAMLKKLDPARAHTIDLHNPRRLVRAIEITKALGSVPKLKKSKRYNTLMIGLQPNLKRIKTQGTRMLKMGLLGEIKELINNGLPKKRIAEMGFEYQYPLDYIEGTVQTLGELQEVLAKENLRYAKRQMTWFRRDKRIVWVKNKNQAHQLVRTFIRT